MLPNYLVDLSKKYAGILSKLEKQGSRLLENEMAVIRNNRRVQLLREREELRRHLEFRRNQAAILLKLKLAKPPTVSFTSRLRAVWEENRSIAELETANRSEDIENTEAASQIREIENVKPETEAPKTSISQYATEDLLQKPDQFTVSASMYRTDALSSSRLVCRKCDYTISRGARGVHLFSWFDNFHIALNEEIADTVSFRKITNPEELKKSVWKKAKVVCPCCGSNIGSLGLTNFRSKVMFKGINVAWRKTVVYPTSPSSRPIGSVVASSWLLSNAGLMTHNKRWVLDTTMLQKLVNQTSPVKPPLLANDDGGQGLIVRSNEKDPATLTPLMKRLAFRSTAMETMYLAYGKDPSKLNLPVLLKSSLDNCREEELKRDQNPTVELSEESCLDNIRASELIVRFAFAVRLAFEPTIIIDDQIQNILNECALDLKNPGEEIEILPARVLCAVAKVLKFDRDSLESIVNILKRRKEEFGQAAGAFGRSSEYLRSALMESKCYSSEEIQQRLDLATSPHPTMGGRFGTELEPSGFAELLCTFGSGIECSHRATHADARNKHPVYCKSHAPPHFVGTVEGYRGIIPAYEEPSKIHKTPFNHPSPQHHPHEGHYRQSIWHRKKDRIVEVPDPNETTFTPPDPSTLFMGEEWQNSIQFVSNLENFKSAIHYFEQHIYKAESNCTSNTPSTEYAIGIDVEWKPEFIYNAENNVCSIIQVATREKCFIFDAIALGGELAPLMRKLLRSKHVIKVGHGLGEDLSRIAQFIATNLKNPEDSKTFFPAESILELAPLYSKAESRVFQFGTLPSLASMVEAATGKRLDKRCQMTDWERRPLSPAQIRYAATDASCSFLLLDHFTKKIESSGVKLDLSLYLVDDKGATIPQRAQITPVNEEPNNTNIEATKFDHNSSQKKGEERSFEDLKKDLISKGVRVDENVTADGLKVASNHLQNSLNRVLRDSLYDPFAHSERS